MKNNFFGKNLKLLRAVSGKSQEYVANALGIRRTSVSLWETGITEPNLDRLKEIAKLFDVTIDNLLEDI